MATRRRRLIQAFAQVTRSMTSNGAQALAGWLRRSSTVATRFWASTCEALRHWLKGNNIVVVPNIDNNVIVVAEIEVENLGTEEDPIDLPKIYLKKGDLRLFEEV